MDLQPDGKVALALVTGARKGIGRHVAEDLAAEAAGGANVAITARTAAAPEVVAREIRAAEKVFARDVDVDVDGAQRKAIMDH